MESMEGTRAPPSEPVVPGQGGLLSDEDVVANLQRGQAVQNDVQQALASLASALASVSDQDGIIRTVKRRFDERDEACANLATATEEARVEKESRAQLNRAQSDRESSLRQEIGRLERELNTAEGACTNAQREAETAASTAEKEINRLREKASVAETDAAEWQRKANTGESRLESMTEEVGALHEAMAGLHGEMGAVQRELDGAKASQEKLTTDLSRAEGRHRKSQENYSATLARAKDAEKRLRTETAERERISAELAKLSEASKQAKMEKTALSAEIKRLKESEGVHRGSSDKLAATNRELNALLQRLSADLEDAKSAGESNSKRADATALEAGLREEEGRRIKEALAVTESKLAAEQREKGFLKEALNKSSAEVQARIADVDRQRGELELLEREKHDLILDVQERVRVHKEAKADAERYRERVEQAEKMAKDEESAKLAAESNHTKVLDDLSGARREAAMRDERIEVLRSELANLRRTLEQTTEAAKSRDRENAQRLVQLSQANAKLSSESTSARARVVGAEEATEKAAHDLEDAKKTLEKSKEAGRRAAESVQRLEEELEVADARWTAAQGQLADATRREQRTAAEAKEQLREALESKKKEIDAALREAETHAQRRSVEAEANQRALERNHERAISALREEAKRKLVEEEAKRVREVTDARRKSKAVVEALQTLQGELRNSEAKGSGLERQVSQLSARMNRAGASSVTGGGGIGAAGDDSGRAKSGGTGTGWEGGDSVGRNARGAEVTEAEVASLRRQMKAATQAKETAQRSALEARSRAEDETKRRSSLEESLCRKENEMLAALERLNALKIRHQEAEQGAREAEEDLRSLVRQRESEIESLTRRRVAQNQVLNEALSRLTSSEPFPVDTGNPGCPSISSTASVGGGAAGFPAIPRLIDRGQGLTASLGDSWQATSASSLSPTLGGGAGNSLFGVEASLSVLADGSAGFEPPAPPTVESDHGHRPHHLPNSDDADNNAFHHHNHHHHHSSNSVRRRSGRDMDGNREGRNESKSTGGGGGGGGGGGSGNDDRKGEGRSDNGEKRGERGRRRDSHGDVDDLGHFHVEGTPITRAGDNFPGDRHRSTHDTAVSRTAASGTSRDVESEAAPQEPGDDRSDKAGTGVLRGVSAAIASGALPVGARPISNANSAADQGKPPTEGGRAALANDEETTHDRLPRVASDVPSRTSDRRLNSAGHYEMTSSGGGDGERRGFSRENSGVGNDAGAGLNDEAVTSNWYEDERGEQARRHIDQALRQRALRRRNRWDAGG
eukprot:g2785.t1